MCYFSTFSSYRRGSSLLQPHACSWLVVSMPVEIPPNCWYIPNKWVQFSITTTAAEAVGKDHTSNQAGRSEKEKASNR